MDETLNSSICFRQYSCDSKSKLSPLLFFVPAPSFPVHACTHTHHHGRNAKPRKPIPRCIDTIPIFTNTKFKCTAAAAAGRAPHPGANGPAQERARCHAAASSAPSDLAAAAVAARPADAPCTDPLRCPEPHNPGKPPPPQRRHQYLRLPPHHAGAPRRSPARKSPRYPGRSAPVGARRCQRRKTRRRRHWRCRGTAGPPPRSLAPATPRVAGAEAVRAGAAVLASCRRRRRRRRWAAWRE